MSQTAASAGGFGSHHHHGQGQVGYVLVPATYAQGFAPVQAVQASPFVGASLFQQPAYNTFNRVTLAAQPTFVASTASTQGQWVSVVPNTASGNFVQGSGNFLQNSGNFVQSSGNFLQGSGGFVTLSSGGFVPLSGTNSGTFGLTSGMNMLSGTNTLLGAGLADRDDVLLQSDPQYMLLAQQIGAVHVRGLKTELRASLLQGMRDGGSGRGFGQWMNSLFNIAQRYFARNSGGGGIPTNLFGLIQRLIQDLLKEQGLSSPDDPTGSSFNGSSFNGRKFRGTFQFIDGDSDCCDDGGTTPKKRKRNSDNSRDPGDESSQDQDSDSSSGDGPDEEDRDTAAPEARR